MTVLAATGNTYWAIALSIGLGAAVIVAILLTLLLNSIGASRSRSTACWRSPARSPRTRPTSRSEATAPVLGLIVDEAIVQDGYMNALTDGLGEETAA